VVLSKWNLVEIISKMNIAVAHSGYLMNQKTKKKGKKKECEMLSSFHREVSVFDPA
jgi:hypothetical protein